MAKSNKQQKPQQKPEEKPEETEVPLHERLASLHDYPLSVDEKEWLDFAIESLQNGSQDIPGIDVDVEESKHVQILVRLNGTQYTNDSGLEALSALLTSSGLNWESVNLI